MRRAARIVLIVAAAATPALSLAQEPLPQDPAGLVEMADRLHEGDGVVQNFAKAADLYAQAAAAGNAAAQHALGRYYHAGLGVPRDIDLAIRWLETAAQNGNPRHVYDLGLVLESRGTPDDLARAAKLYETAAAKGLVAAQVSLGMLYQSGLGVPLDYGRARDLYEGPAEDGDAQAQNNLGLLYVRGHGVPQDYERAAELFAAASDQGLRVAMTNLGVMYENAFGVPLDEELAHELYRMGGGGGEGETSVIYDARLLPPSAGEDGVKALERSAKAGDPVAQFQLGWLLLQDQPPAPPAYAQAAMLFRGAAEAGYGPAMVNLGYLYEIGRGVPQDYVEALAWLLMAGTSGAPEALAFSGTLQARMTVEQIAQAQELAESRWQQAQ